MRTGTTAPPSVRRNEAGSGGPASAASRRSSSSEPPDSTSSASSSRCRRVTAVGAVSTPRVDEPPAEHRRGSRVSSWTHRTRRRRDSRTPPPAAGRGRDGRWRDGGWWGEGDGVADGRGDEAEQHRIPSDEFLIRSVRRAWPRRVGGGRDDAQRGGGCRRLGAVVAAVVVEQQAGEDLVAVQCGERPMRPAQEADELSRVERRQRRDRAQVGVDLVDQVVGQRREDDLQAPDPPGRLQRARSGAEGRAATTPRGVGRSGRAGRELLHAAADDDDDRRLAELACSCRAGEAEGLAQAVAEWGDPQVLLERAQW